MALQIFNGKLLIVDGKLTQCADNCCDVTADTCGEVEACLYSGGVLRDIIVDCSNVVDGDCGDCEEIATAWQLPGFPDEPDCTGGWFRRLEELSLCYAVLDISVDVLFDEVTPANCSISVGIVSLPDSVLVEYGLTGSDACAAISALCAGGATIPQTFELDSHCNWPDSINLSLV